MQENHMGHVIRALRLLKGMTQRELAEGICSIKQLSRIERGASITNLMFVHQFSEKLGENLNDFFLISHSKDPIKMLKALKQLEALYLQQNYSEILAYIKHIESHDPEDWEFNNTKQLMLWYKGVALANTHEVEIDETYYLELLKLSTHKPIDELCRSYMNTNEFRIVHSYIASLCRKGSFETAKELLKKISESIKRNYFRYENNIYNEMLYNLTKIYIHEADFDKAVEVAESGIKNSVKNNCIAGIPDFCFMIGLAYQRKGDEVVAIKHYNRFLNLLQVTGYNEYTLKCRNDLLIEFENKLTEF